MKKLLFVSLCFSLLFSNVNIAAQEMLQPQPPTQVLKIGYVNTTELMESLPEKKEASAALNDLNKKYKDELVLMQNDYNKKYSDFITYQNSMGDNIKLRRMQELTELEKSINNFIKVSQADIENRERQLIAPLRQAVNNAIKEVGLEENITCIYDTASPSVVFLTPNAIDLNDAVKKKLTARR